MGFSITNSGGGLGEALLIIFAIGAAIPVAIWFVVMIMKARASVLEDEEHDIEA